MSGRSSKDGGHGSLLRHRTRDRQGWISRATDAAGPERIEAFFAGRGYDMHRHDTYAIGCTLSGVQSFRYRGAVCNSLPGGTIVLHPDEPHDGQAGTDDGFHYRIAYVEPSEIQAVLGGRPLPFIQGGISADLRLLSVASRILRDVDDPIKPIEYEDALFELANALEAAANRVSLRQRRLVNYAAAEIARQYLAERPEAVTLEQLETICGQDRWSLSRDFRALFGTSPYRYLTMRRLDAVKTFLRDGSPLADAAFLAGFADQSHMTRQFSKAFGVSPGRWLTLTREAR